MVVDLANCKFFFKLNKKSSKQDRERAALFFTFCVCLRVRVLFGCPFECVREGVSFVYIYFLFFNIKITKSLA